MRIGTVELSSPFALAPMAGMTDTAFRRLVKRLGGCGLVVTEMVSAEGLMRGVGRTLEYAEFTEEERPVAVQLVGGDPATMAEAARLVEAMGADLVDVNMGCPVPKVARHEAGCGLMRDPARAAAIVSAMVRAVTIPAALPASEAAETSSARGRERWVVNKLRTLAAWYTRGLERGAQLRAALNRVDSVAALGELIEAHYFEVPASGEPPSLAEVGQRA